MIKEKIIFVAMIFLSLSLVVAQHQKLDVEHLGFGKTQKETKIGIRNVGNDVIDDTLNLVLDGEIYTKTRVNLEPLSGYVANVFVEKPGEHILLVSTSDGSYDSVTFFTTYQEEKPTTVTTNFLEKNKILFSILVVLLIFGIATWVVTRKTKL